MQVHADQNNYPTTAVFPSFTRSFVQELTTQHSLACRHKQDTDTGFYNGSRVFSWSLSTFSTVFVMLAHARGQTVGLSKCLAVTFLYLLTSGTVLVMQACEVLLYLFDFSYVSSWTCNTVLVV